MLAYLPKIGKPAPLQPDVVDLVDLHAAYNPCHCNTTQQAQVFDEYVLNRLYSTRLEDPMVDDILRSRLRPVFTDIL